MPKTRSVSKRSKRVSPRQSSASASVETSKIPLATDDVSNKVSEKSNEAGSDCAENNESKQNAGGMQDIVNSLLECEISDEVNDDARKVLADQCSLKLKSVVEASVDYMKRCGRQKFTVEDFNKGLAFCGETPFMPHELVVPPEKPKKKKRSRAKTSKKKCQEVCYVGDQCVNNDESCSLQYSALSAETPQSVIRKEKWLNNKSPFFKDFCDCPEELQIYFKEITKALITETEEVCCVIFNDLKTNENICCLVPYFVNFFCDAVDKYSSDFLRISVLLKSIQSLLLNPNLYYGEDMYLNMLAHSLLQFLLSHLPYMNQDIDYWLLKDTAASTLAFILKRSNSKELFFHALSEIKFVLCDFLKGMDIHYGALVALNSIGVPAVFSLIPVYLEQYIEHMKSISVSYFEDAQNICMVEGQIMHSYFLLVSHSLKYEFNRPTFNVLYKNHSKFYMPGFLKENSVFPILLQSKFKEYFGDSLVPSYDSLLNSTSHVICPKEESEKAITITAKKKCHSMKNISYSMLLL